MQEKLFVKETLPDSLPVILPPDQSAQEQKTVDMESLVRYILGSTQFQQQLASKTQAGEERSKLDKDHLMLTINQQNHFHEENAKVNSLII